MIYVNIFMWTGSVLCIIISQKQSYLSNNVLHRVTHWFAQVFCIWNRGILCNEYWYKRWQCWHIHNDLLFSLKLVILLCSNSLSNLVKIIRDRFYAMDIYGSRSRNMEIICTVDLKIAGIWFVPVFSFLKKAHFT